MGGLLPQGPSGLGPTQLAVLEVLWDDPDLPELRAAAVEAAARLPLSPGMWEVLGDQLLDLLDDPGQVTAIAPVVRAAGRAPLVRVRRRLVEIAGDPAHPGHRPARLLLAEVDLPTLAGDVLAVLREPLTEASAHRLAGLPLERLPIPPDRLPHGETDAQAWWIAVAAARLGDLARLDAILRAAAQDAMCWPVPDGAVGLAQLRAVRPLPESLLTHVASSLVAGIAARRAITEAWLEVDTEAGAAQLATLLAELEPRLGAADPQEAIAACHALRDAAAVVDPARLATHVPNLAESAPLPTYTSDDAEPPPPRRTGSRGGRRGLERGEPAGDDGPATDVPVVYPSDFRSYPPADAGPRETGAPGPAYAKLACPRTVVAESPFELEIGLAATPMAGVVSAPLSLPDRAAYALTVLLVADGFRLGDGELPTVALPVDAEHPYPTRTVHLTAVADDTLEPIRTVLAVFTVDGVTVGSAARSVVVLAEGSDLPGTDTLDLATGVDTAAPVVEGTPDLTVTISHGADQAGRTLLWTFHSPHAAVTDTPEPLAMTLPEDRAEFARKLSRKAATAQGEQLALVIRGAGMDLVSLIPPEVITALRAVAAPHRAPTVLLLTQEASLPWELALIQQPWLAGAPGFLGAQAVVGRWALSGPAAPEPPVEVDVDVDGMVVVRGIYDKVLTFKRLKWAEQEADDLVAAYAGQLVDATQPLFYQCLRGEPAGTVLHMALHGKFDPTGLEDGLILADASVVSRWEIQASDLDRAPFVFLNACQVGQAGETLGQYGGMAQAFVTAGASAVVAPLWVVDDEVARDVSLRFYQAVFSGTTPAEFLRAERGAGQSGTNLAYVFYGHPNLRLHRPAGSP